MSRMQNIARPSGGRGDPPAKEVRGAQAPVKTLKRLLKYSFSRYKVATVFVILFVLLSAGTTALGASFFAPIITELMNGVPNGMWAIYKNIIIIGCIYFVGALSSFAYNRIMIDRKSVV